MNGLRRWMAVVLVLSMFTSVALMRPSVALSSSTAGLYWGPVYVGNLKLSLTNAHYGYAGPRVLKATHTNFHVYVRSAPSGYKLVGNFHITRYGSGSSSCAYVWDSVSGAVVFDKCLNTGVRQLADAVAQAIKSFVRTLVDNADWFALLAIALVVTAAIIAIILVLPVVALADHGPHPNPAAATVGHEHSGGDLTS